MIKLFLIILLISPTFGDVVYRVPIEGTIDLGLPPFIQRTLDKAESENASLVITMIINAIYNFFQPPNSTNSPGATAAGCHIHNSGANKLITIMASP